MKNTYLVKKQNDNGMFVLEEVSGTQWIEIVKRNKSLPKEQKRYFSFLYISQYHTHSKSAPFIKYLAIFIEMSNYPFIWYHKIMQNSIFDIF